MTVTVPKPAERAYHTALGRIRGTDWSRVAVAYLTVHFATVLWIIYVQLLAFSEGSSDVFSLVIGLESALDASIQGLALGAIIAPVLFVGIVTLSRVLPIRRVYAQTLVPWLLACPIGLVAFLGVVMFDGDAQLGQAVFDTTPWLVAEWTFMWTALSTLLVVFVGGAYALATRSVRPSPSHQRALVVAIVVLVALPAVVSAAVPMGDDSTDEPEIDSSHGDELEDGTEPDDEDSSDDESSLERLLDGRDAADPETYDDGEYSPRIRNATVVDSESDVTISAVSGDELPPANATVDRPIAEVHTDASAVSASNIEFEIQNETVVPNARYHLDIEGVDTSSSATLAYPSSYAYGETSSEDAHSMITSGPYVDIEDGYYVDMEQIDSMYVYMDVVTEGGEIHRYVVQLERNDI